MSRLRQVAAALLAVAFAAVLPETAVADNCSGLTDCYGVLEAAALALLAMAILAFLVFNPGLLLAAASLLESMLFAPLGWLTGWGRGWGGTMAAAGVEAGWNLTAAEWLAATRALGPETVLRALGPAAFNPSSSPFACFGVSRGVLTFLRTGVVNPALPASVPVSNHLLAAAAGRSFVPVTFEGISANLAASGPGAGGLVHVNNRVVGHVFTAANVDGVVIFADMGRAAVISGNAAEVATAAGYGDLIVEILFLGL